MTDQRPNILLLMTDQQRGDCLGIAGHPVVQTPNLDDIAGHGVYFPQARSACPVCIPARRTLMTGKKPATHGVLMNFNTRLDGPTLPGELSRAGYQTHLCGKLHLWPHRKLFGFDSADWADGAKSGNDDDYVRFLRREGVTIPGAGMANGIGSNAYPARPFHMDERFHFTNWVTDGALNFLERRDPTLPFFLKVSYLQPHQPLTPPRCYWDRYINMDLPEPKVGEWSKIYDEPQKGLPTGAWRLRITPEQQKQMQAGYYGCVNHVDDQIGRIRAVLPSNTIIIFVADHGEMLGDHQWIRKRNGFEGSCRIPFMINFPDSMEIEQGKRSNALVELMDVMPTLLDAVGVQAPEGMDGDSLMPVVRGEKTSIRDVAHGECAAIPTIDSGMQYMTDGRRKYIYYPADGSEQLFDLENDPDEMIDLAPDAKFGAELETWRDRLTVELDGRPEGFVKDGRLTPVGRPTPLAFPEYERGV